MSFDPRAHLTALLRSALESVAPDHGATPIALEKPKQASHGDFATNLAMLLAKSLRLAPREVAARLVGELPAAHWLAKIEVAGAGFINFTLTGAAKTRIVGDILAAGPAYGRSSVGAGRSIQVEFVSANPTGPLHVGHGRGAAYGASLAALLDFAGFRVSREYYVNDAGRQMDILALSTWLRYLELHGEPVPFPPNAYLGDYVRSMAAQIRDAHGDRYVHPAEAVLACVPAAPPAERGDDEAKRLREEHLDALITAARDLLGEDWNYIHHYALTEQLADCRSDMEDFGVHFEQWFSERSLFDTGLVARVKGAVAALGLDPARLEVALVQFAVLYRGGQKTSMSTRSGEFVTLRELRREVGNDAARFFYVLRKSDQHLDFDLDLARSQSSDNPVYYIQYAHARICSVLAQWGGNVRDLHERAWTPLVNERELALCALLREFPQVIETAAAECAPHQIAFYLKDLAAEFHAYYNAERLLVDDPALKAARLALAAAVRQVLQNGLQLLGVSSPEQM